MVDHSSEVVITLVPYYFRRSSGLGPEEATMFFGGGHQRAFRFVDEANPASWSHD
jgi:hypothetical protein